MKSLPMLCMLAAAMPGRAVAGQGRMKFVQGYGLADLQQRAPITGGAAFRIGSERHFSPHGQVEADPEFGTLRWGFDQVRVCRVDRWVGAVLGVAAGALGGLITYEIVASATAGDDAVDGNSLKLPLVGIFSLAGGAAGFIKPLEYSCRGSSYKASDYNDRDLGPVGSRNHTQRLVPSAVLAAGRALSRYQWRAEAGSPPQ